MNQTDWMTLEQLSDYLQLEPKSIYELTHKRLIPFSRIGRRLRFLKGNIDAWLGKNSFDVLKR